MWENNREYGFDFDGATNILAYTNPTINAFNSEYSFTVKKGDSGTFSYLFKGGASGGITSFDVFFADTNTLRTTFRYGGAVVGSVSMESINSFNVGELLNVRIVFATVSLQSKVSLYIDNILQDEVFLPVAITSLSYNLVENQSVYGFSYPWLFGYYTESIISNFIVYSDGLKVFEETFNKITKGTIIGIEQYEAIGTEEITVVDIDNSTRLLTLTNLSVNYIGSNTQYIDLGLQNLEEI